MFERGVGGRDTSLFDIGRRQSSEFRLVSRVGGRGLFTSSDGDRSGKRGSGDGRANAVGVVGGGRTRGSGCKDGLWGQPR